MTDLIEPAILTYLMVFARVATALRLMPLLGGDLAPSFTWLAVSAALSMPLAVLPGAPATCADASWLAAALGQIAAGAVIGAAGRIVLVLLEIPGGLSGFVLWPEAPSQGHGPDLAPFYSLAGIAALMATGGHRGLIAALSASFELSTESLAVSSVHAWSQLAGGLLLSGALLALPVLACGLLADAVKGLLERLAGGPSNLPVSALRQLAVQVAVAVAFTACVSKFLEACAFLGRSILL
jgi:flagellar biosynthesis protein FliR